MIAVPTELYLRYPVAPLDFPLMWVGTTKAFFGLVFKVMLVYVWISYKAISHSFSVGTELL